MIAVFFAPSPQPAVVMYWMPVGNDASACVWEVPGTNHEDYE